MMIRGYTKELFEDLVYICGNLRVDFVKEDAVESAKRHAKSGELFIVYGDKPMAAFGLFGNYPFGEYRQQAFFLATDEANGYKKNFVRLGRQYLDEWVKKYGKLYCLINVSHIEAWRMIKAFGFKHKANFGDYEMFIRM